MRAPLPSPGRRRSREPAGTQRRAKDGARGRVPLLFHRTTVPPMLHFPSVLPTERPKHSPIESEMPARVARLPDGCPMDRDPCSSKSARTESTYSRGGTPAGRLKYRLWTMLNGGNNNNNKEGCFSNRENNLDTRISCEIRLKVTTRFLQSDSLTTKLYVSALSSKTSSIYPCISCSNMPLAPCVNAAFSHSCTGSALVVQVAFFLEGLK